MAINGKHQDSLSFPPPPLKEIESLFWKLECDHSSLEKVLGGTTTAQDKNVAIYLSIIEQKVNQLLTMYSYKKAEVCRQQQDWRWVNSHFCLSVWRKYCVDFFFYPQVRKR